MGGAGLDHPAELQGVEPAGLRGGGDPGEPAAEAPAGLGRHRGAAAAAAPGLDEPRLPQRGDGLAQRGPADGQPLGELALGRQQAADGVDPEPDRGRQLLDAALEGVVTAHRPEHRSGEVLVRLGGHAGQSVQVRAERQWSEFIPIFVWTLYGRIGAALAVPNNH